VSATLELLQEHGTAGSPLICQSIQALSGCSTQLCKHGKVSKHRVQDLANTRDMILY
jgi:hypothetical protein